MENYSSPDLNTTWKIYYNITSKEDAHHVRATSVVSAVISALVFLFGPIMNGFVLWFLFFKMEKKYRGFLYIHLFFAGFTFSIFKLMDLVYFALDLHWSFDSFLCRLSSAVFYLYMIVSALILTLFSIDFCLLILCTFRYISCRTRALAYKQLLVIWIFSLGVSVPYFIFKITYDCQNSTKCLYGVLYNEKVQNQSIVATAFVLGFFIPFLITVLCFIITRFHHRKKNIRYNARLKLIFSLQMCFVLCWVPHHVFSFLSSFPGERLPNSQIDEGLHLTTALASLTSCINPLMYVFICPDFKKTFFLYFKKNISRNTPNIF
ncbi:chemerin-like receptor 1 [Engystomops pustulosus]|uniref:chemerin-like receptor 1 n=1 Tax=Engystomops pustulosus TaxID=76066 RepID=UPI003AFA14E1